MSTGQLAIVFHHSASTGSDRLVMLSIADHDGEGGAWPSVPTLARMAKVSESTVRRAIKELVALGELAVHVQQGGTLATPHHRRPNRYDVLLACPAWCDGTARHACRTCRERGEHKAECPHALSTGVSPVTPHDSSTGVSPVTPHPLSPVTPEPPKETTTPPHPPAPALPESVARLWGGQGIGEDEQQALWAALLADPDTLVPARRAQQAAWLVPALAQLRAKNAKTRGAALDHVRRYGESCEHDTPGGAALHPETGLPLCPLCRAKAKTDE